MFMNTSLSEGEGYEKIIVTTSTVLCLLGDTREEKPREQQS
jgi:hypothetical protein